MKTNTQNTWFLLFGLLCLSVNILQAQVTIIGENNVNANTTYKYTYQGLDTSGPNTFGIEFRIDDPTKGKIINHLYENESSIETGVEVVWYIQDSPSLSANLILGVETYDGITHNLINATDYTENIQIITSAQQQFDNTKIFGETTVVPGTEYTYYINPITISGVDDAELSVSGGQMVDYVLDNNSFMTIITVVWDDQSETSYLQDLKVHLYMDQYESGNYNGFNKTLEVFYETAPLVETPLSASQNYIKTKTFISDANGDRSKDIESITYIDDIGRPFQQIAIKGGGQEEDIVTPFEYDGFGRQNKEYLPYAVSNTNNGNIRTTPIAEIHSFYNTNKYENTLNPYSEALLENSPLSRPLSQGAPGNDWKISQDIRSLNNSNIHSIKTEYSTNVIDNASSSLYKVIYFKNDSKESPDLLSFGQYAAADLYKTIVKDENWTGGKNHTTEEYKNKQGQVVLKRTFAEVDLDSDGTIEHFNSSYSEKYVPHDTYYVYDDYGNLSYVLPPKMNASKATLADIKSKLADLAYQYKYDVRNRLIEKQLPGKGKEYIVYNTVDQPIMTQDAIQKANGEWLFTKYDVFGRVAYTGIFADTRDRIAIQNEVNTQLANTNIWVKRETMQQYGGATIYYNNGAYPTTSISEILTINYYDDYDFDRAGASVNIDALGIQNTTKTKGLTTGSKVKVLDNTVNKWITTVSYYNAKARPIYTYSHNDYLNTIDIVKSKLDFVGKVEKTVSIHSKTGKDDIVVTDQFEYDHMGRLLSQVQSLANAENVISSYELDGSDIQNITYLASGSIILKPSFTGTPGFIAKIVPGNAAQDKEVIAINTYDELGQLEKKKVGGPRDLNVAIKDNNTLQTIDYKYNIRGWLKSINDNNYTTDGYLSSSYSDLFAFKIDYNNTNTGTALYNGNISSVQWKTRNEEDQTTKSYNYTYDALNRITRAIDNTNNYNLNGVSYDKNGNIITLERQGHTNVAASSFGVMDNLSYTYNNGNQLQSVSDQGASTGFLDGNTNGNDFGYDVNGNMTADANKGINAILYNHLNLPTDIDINDGGSNNGTISYIYDATGVKLKKEVSTGAITEYAGNYVYEDGSLKFFNHPEGYVSAELVSGSVQYDYVYQYKDHLGNVRLSYKDSDNSGSVISSEILEENNYYPFGLQHKGYNNVVSANANSTAQKFKYANKEKEEELGRNTIAYGWRDYDPAIARFTNIDRYAEKYRNESPYHFTKNNPILYREIQGDSVWVFTERTAGVGRHAFLRVKTDKVDKIVELWGPDQGGRTGRPRVDDFQQNGYKNGRSGVSDPFLIQPSSSNENNEFENSILDLAGFFQEQSTDEDGNQDYDNLPKYDFTGPNSNGFVVSLVGNANGGVKLKLPFNAIGQKDTKAYDLAINGLLLQGIRDKVCNSGTCSKETLQNLDALIQRNNEQLEQYKNGEEED